MRAEDASSPILITGAAGFIGGEFARLFADAGRRVAAFDLPGRPVSHLSRAGISLLEGDVTSRADCDRAIAASAPSAVVHCAAAMGGSVPRETFMRVNTSGTATLAEAAAAAGVRRLIYISSVTVHGMPNRRGIAEDLPSRSIGLPYADSKIEAERLLMRLHEEGRIRLTILRPGDVYGPRAGEWVIKLVAAMRSGRMILIGGGRGFVNTTYVENLFDAAAACFSTSRSEGQAYLITDGEPVSWKRYLTALAAAAGVAPPRLSLPTLAAWPLVLAMEAAMSPFGWKPPLGRMGLRLLTSRSSYSIEKAKADLGFSPRISFAEGMDRVAAWIRESEPPRSALR
jgi:nucleoside-diphosphate-sugar epimerase